MSYECQIIVDFEFNPTEKQYRNILRHEIIEIGAIKLNENLEEIGRFSCLVKPEFNSRIEPDIVRLTGIRDSDISEAVSFATAIGLFSEWAGTARCRVMSWSNSDVIQLDDECWAKGIPFPENLTHWMDFQRVWQRIIHYPTSCLMSLKYAASVCGIHWDESKSHRALYDADITAELLRLTRNREYTKHILDSGSRATTSVERSTYSIASVYGDALSALIERLQSV